MGIVHPGVPKELALFLRDTANVTVFVETGTYLGDTAAWASRQFKRVITIEASETLANDARARWSHLTNIEFLTGESLDQLRLVVPLLDSPTLFWLDAHWSVGNTYGGEKECPLLEEIGALRTVNNLNILLIDDARLFLAPPPPPHQIAAWPAIVDVLDAIREVIPDAYIAVTEDVIIAVPGSLKQDLASYAQGLSAKHDAERLKAARRKGRFSGVKHMVRQIMPRQTQP